MISWWSGKLLIARWRETQIEIVWAFWSLNFSIGRQRCISDMIYIRLSPHVWVTAVAVLLLSQPAWRQVTFQRPGAVMISWWSGKLLIARWRETQIEIVWAFWILNFGIGRQCVCSSIQFWHDLHSAEPTCLSDCCCCVAVVSACLEAGHVSKTRCCDDFLMIW